MREAIARLEALMNELVEADQSGSGIEPLKVAGELGAIRQLITEAPAVIRRAGGEQHFRCEGCGTIVHGAAPPARCPECGRTKFFSADIEQPDVESGAG